MQEDRGSNIAGHEVESERLERNPPTGASAGGKEVELRARSMRKRQSGQTEEQEEARQEEKVSDGVRPG